MSKNIITIKSIAEGYNKSIQAIPETIRKNYSQYTPLAQDELVKTEREKIAKDYQGKVNTWLASVIADKNRARKEYFSMKYPNRLSELSTFREIGQRERTNALLFLNFSSDAGILQEIRQAFELNDIDYASNLIDGVRAKVDIYTREELNNLTTNEASANLDKVNQSNKYLSNPETFPLLNEVEKIELEKFPKLKELKTEIRDFETEAGILNEFSKQLDAGSEYLRSAELFPFLTEPERLEMLNHSASNQIENIAFRRRAAEIWKQNEGKNQ